MTIKERMSVVRQLFAADRLHESTDAFAMVKVANDLPSEEALPLLHRSLETVQDGHNRLAILTYLAAAYRNIGEFDTSWRYGDEAIYLDPENKDVRLGRAYGLLLRGSYEEGLRDFDLRIGMPRCKLQYQRKPLWDGVSTGATILVTFEQGRGDQIQMVRFLEREPLTRNRLWVECHTELVPLFTRLRHIEKVFPFSDQLPVEEDKLDFQLPFMSLAHAMRATYSPDLFRGSYLIADARKNSWHQQLNSKGFKVGVVWRGSSKQERDRYRSIPLEQFAPLLGVKGISFYSLVVEPAGIQELQKLGAGSIVDLSNQLTDFDQTAAVIANLDLIISADTAVAHLAGALDKEVWVPLSKSLDWRWGIEGETTFWYPSMKLVRQTALNDWPPVVECLKTMLEARVGGDA